MAEGQRKMAKADIAILKSVGIAGTADNKPGKDGPKKRRQPMQQAARSSFVLVSLSAKTPRPSDRDLHHDLLHCHWLRSSASWLVGIFWSNDYKVSLIEKDLAKCSWILV
jgi:hypothetical protein